MSSGQPDVEAPSGQPLPADNTLRAYKQVRGAILSGALTPGSWVSQVQLAAQLEVSRTPLREALRLLQTEGLVRSDFNRRVRVAPISIADLEGLYAMRLAAEPLAARLTVRELTDEDLGELLGAHAAMHTDDDPATIADNHRRFHLGLVAYAPDRLRRHVEDLWDHAERYRIVYQEYDRHRAALIALAATEHELILRAAEERDAALCSRRAAQHLARSALTIVAKVDGSHDPQVIRDALRYVVEPA